jgi:hypothetical protein
MTIAERDQALARIHRRAMQLKRTCRPDGVFLAVVLGELRAAYRVVARLDVRVTRTNVAPPCGWPDVDPLELLLAGAELSVDEPEPPAQLVLGRSQWFGGTPEHTVDEDLFNLDLLRENHLCAQYDPDRDANPRSPTAFDPLVYNSAGTLRYEDGFSDDDDSMSSAERDARRAALFGLGPVPNAPEEHEAHLRTGDPAMFGWVTERAARVRDHDREVLTAAEQGEETSYLPAITAKVRTHRHAVNALRERFTVAERDAQDQRLGQLVDVVVHDLFGDGRTDEAVDLADTWEEQGVLRYGLLTDVAMMIPNPVDHPGQSWPKALMAERLADGRVPDVSLRFDSGRVWYADPEVIRREWLPAWRERRRESPIAPGEHRPVLVADPRVVRVELPVVYGPPRPHRSLLTPVGVMTWRAERRHFLRELAASIMGTSDRSRELRATLLAQADAR